MHNLLCPYTANPVAEIKTSREHIVPDALGGPDAFAVRACEEKNSIYGNSIDSRLVHAPLVAFLAMSTGAQTRNGPATMKTRGKLVLDGSPVDIILSKDSIDCRLRIPVVKDPDNGKPVGVRGFGNDAKREFAKISKQLKKKGQDVNLGRSEAFDPWTMSRLAFNQAYVAHGLGKIAYLMTVWTLGDDFIDAPGASQYRRWIEAEPTEEALRAAGLRVLPLGKVEEIHHVLEGGLNMPSNSHVLTCHAVQNEVVTTVRLFDSPLLAFGSVAKMSGMRTPSQRVKTVVIDPSAKTYGELEVQGFL